MGAVSGPAASITAVPGPHHERARHEPVVKAASRGQRGTVHVGEYEESAMITAWATQTIFTPLPPPLRLASSGCMSYPAPPTYPAVARQTGSGTEQRDPSCDSSKGAQGAGKTTVGKILGGNGAASVSPGVGAERDTTESGDTR